MDNGLKFRLRPSIPWTKSDAGLNNYLKHSQKSFSYESANLLISSIERNCNNNFPFANLITLPLKPADFKVTELLENEYFFNSLVAEIVTKYFMGSIDFAQKIIYTGLLSSVSSFYIKMPFHPD